MTAAGPVRDSVLNALGYAIRVAAKPGYWWAPALLTTISVLPILALPGMPGMPGAGGFGTGGFGQRPFETQAELEAYFRSFVPVLVLSVLLTIVIGPISAATAYRGAIQFANGEGPDPFRAGFIDLAWRFFLQFLALLGLFLGGFILFALVFALSVVTGSGLVILAGMVAWFVATLAFVVRLAIAPALLGSGAGPIESITRAWQMTRGRFLLVLRWVLVAGVIVSLGASAISGVVSYVFGAVGLYPVGAVVGMAFVGPFSVVSAIVLVLLARLLSGPIEPPPPPELPAWMNAPSSEPPAPPAPPSTVDPD
jgi:hypothetical protein